jgi:hypothetical protein
MNKTRSHLHIFKKIKLKLDLTYIYFNFLNQLNLFYIYNRTRFMNHKQISRMSNEPMALLYLHV